MFDPSNFTVAKARPIPLYLLLDTSGSMSDYGKIDELNKAVRIMLTEFEKEQQRETRIDVSVISFGHNGVQLELRNVAAADARGNYRDLPADGLTPMGGALRMAKAMIEDKDETPSNAYRPTIVLVSDGEPNDEWEEAIEAFIGSGRSSKCDRMAMAIGTSAQRAPLERFLQGTENAVFDASHAAGIHAFFKQVTMSISVRSRAANPNALPPAPPPPELPDNDGSLFF